MTKKFFSRGTGVVHTRNRADLQKAIKLLTEQQVLVGFPSDTATRQPEPGELNPPNNATIAYIQDNGAPEANIPQREFMKPAMYKAQVEVVTFMEQMARKIIHTPRPETVKQGFGIIGLRVVAAIQARIREGIPPPLAESTLAARANRGGKGKGRKGAVLELARRARGEAPSTEFAKPLVDTSQLLRAATYVIRKVGGK